MQKYRREGRKNGLEDLTIGFGVYQVDGPKPTKKLDQTFFQTHRSIANTTFTNLREVNKKQEGRKKKYRFLVNATLSSPTWNLCYHSVYL